VRLQPNQTDPRDPAHETQGAYYRAAGLGGQVGSRIVGGCWCIEHPESDPIDRIEQIVREHTTEGCSWAIMLSYELGCFAEPRADAGLEDPLGFPLCVLMRLGEPMHDQEHAPTSYGLGRATSMTGRARYIEQVEQVRAYIAAGDIYQANIAHHLSALFKGDPIACSHELQRGAAPRYGATMRFDHAGKMHTICSISPELFVRLDRSSAIVQSEPMKGTRAIGSDANELEQSPKDRAELNMITDLMRNDLGRVCSLGSVRVRQARKIEPHASGVIQASSVVEGTLRDGIGLASILRAIFPPGSVTGAPKVRAMQIISELERRPRRAYCGSMLHIDQRGNIEASVSIRTAHIWGEADPDQPGSIRDGQFVYPVGAGIVTDSDPSAEWAETLVKAAVLERVLGVDLTDLGD
jgi:para-aminobenzoate synthetase component 1